MRFIIVIASVFNTDLYCISVHTQICPPTISVCSFNASTEVGKMQTVKLIILVCYMLFMFYRMCMHNDNTKECVQTMFRED